MWYAYSGSFLNLKTYPRGRDWSNGLQKNKVICKYPIISCQGTDKIVSQPSKLTPMSPLWLSKYFKNRPRDKLHDCISLWRVAHWIVPCIMKYWSPAILQDSVNIVCLSTIRFKRRLNRVRLLSQIPVSICTNANNYTTIHWTCQYILKNLTRQFLTSSGIT